MSGECLHSFRIVLAAGAERGGVEALEIMEASAFWKSGPAHGSSPFLTEIAGKDGVSGPVGDDEVLAHWFYGVALLAGASGVGQRGGDP
jgi:hypothetical protein